MLARRVIGLGLGLALGLAGCSKVRLPIDAPDFGETCMPTGTFSLANRFAVQGILNVHVNSSGLVEVDTTAELLLAMDVVQTGTSVAITATPCAIHIPDIPLAGQPEPIEFQVPDATLASVGTVTGAATLSDPAHDVRGVHVGADHARARRAPRSREPRDRAAARRRQRRHVPDVRAIADHDVRARDRHRLRVRSRGRRQSGRHADRAQRAGDQPRRGLRRAAHDVHAHRPGVDLDVAIKGEIDATLGQGILACKLTDGTACTSSDVTAVATLNPMITPQPGNPSTFAAVQVDPGYGVRRHHHERVDAVPAVARAFSARRCRAPHGMPPTTAARCRA